MEQEREDMQDHCLQFLITNNTLNGLLAIFHSMQLT